MKIALLFGSLETLTPAKLTADDIGLIFGEPFKIFEPQWMPANELGSYNSDLIFREDHALAKTVGFALRCETRDDIIPLFVVPQTSKTPELRPAVATFLEGVRLGADCDCVTVVPTMLVNALSTSTSALEDMKSLTALVGQTHPTTVRFLEPNIIAVDPRSSDPTDLRAAQNLVIRDIAFHLTKALKRRGIQITLTDAENKMTRLMRKMSKASMQVYNDKHSDFADRLAEMIVLDLVHDLRTRGT